MAYNNKQTQYQNKQKKNKQQKITLPDAYKEIDKQLKFSKKEIKKKIKELGKIVSKEYIPLELSEEMLLYEINTTGIAQKSSIEYYTKKLDLNTTNGQNRLNFYINKGKTNINNQANKIKRRILNEIEKNKKT